MQRIKYIKIGETIEYLEILDIYAREVDVRIDKMHKVFVKISRRNDPKTETFELSSLQNAKRKVRKILKEEFEVNLGDEVRSKICF